MSYCMALEKRKTVKGLILLCILFFLNRNANEGIKWQSVTKEYGMS